MSRGYTFTDEQEAEMIRLIHSHITLNEIGKRFGCSDDRIRKVAAKYGVIPNARGHGPEMGEKIRVMYEDGQPFRVISETLGVTFKVIDRFIKEMGLVRKVKTKYKKRDQKPYREAYIERYGEQEGLIRFTALQAKHRANAIGENNPMYGKPSPQRSGNGWKGWYRGHYFRSLREAMFMISLDEKGLPWVTGEAKETTVPYTLNGVKRTYRPDFVVGDKVYELKPIRLHASPAVVAKRDAAIPFFAAIGKEYLICDVEVSYAKIAEYLDRGDIRFDRDYEARFKQYLTPQTPRSSH